jgi:hypothetical protein
MTVELIFGAGLLLVFLLTFVCWRADINVWKLWLRLLDEAKLRKQIELDALQNFHIRLKNLTSEMLDKANEMDQDSKLLNRDMPKDWSRTMGATCSQLVMLADQTKLIEEYLQKRDPRAVRQLLAGACNLAGKTGTQLKWLRINGQSKSAETPLLNQVHVEGQTSSN